MKKILFLGMIVLSLTACKSTIDNKSQVGIKGNWIITKVSYPGSDVIKVNSFDIADSKCFEESTWKFISNNNKGSMSLNKPGCITFSSDIVWSISKEGQFGLKILNTGEKASKVHDGYFLQVANQTDDSFQLVDKINVGGKPTAITYQFKKIN